MVSPSAQSASDELIVLRATGEAGPPSALSFLSDSCGGRLRHRLQPSG